MPFMRGQAPIRRTIGYLNKGNLIFKDSVKIITCHYNKNQVASKGTEDFVFWHFAQMQFKNPDTQIVILNNMTPSPYIQCYFDEGTNLVLDLDSQDKNTILNRVRKIFCKTETTLQAEQLAREMKDNPANFGYRCNHHCICEVPGQLPCPKYVPLPKHMRAKYKGVELEDEPMYEPHRIVPKKRNPELNAELNAKLNAELK